MRVLLLIFLKKVNIWEGKREVSYFGNFENISIQYRAKVPAREKSTWKETVGGLRQAEKNAYSVGQIRKGGKCVQYIELDDWETPWPVNDELVTNCGWNTWCRQITGRACQHQTTDWDNPPQHRCSKANFSN
ncbi:hypothetical protein ZHAS_00016284 [Anopheles sinensis]|uniref:Uncharacterized protein n=1 Tax=Anopheles sinensis TaxID=74873 RepID=A0A084WDL1_ANOSI|nr:hypothetical protein ZHAS_00016284 [Anopheles sinensis]